MDTIAGFLISSAIPIFLVYKVSKKILRVSKKIRTNNWIKSITEKPEITIKNITRYFRDCRKAEKRGNLTLCLFYLPEKKKKRHDNRIKYHYELELNEIRNDDIYDVISSQKVLLQRDQVRFLNNVKKNQLFDYIDRFF